MARRDDLQAYVADRNLREPGFEDLVAAAEQRQALTRRLAERRKEAHLSQTKVAAMMGTSAAVVSRVETGADVRLSTLQKYAAVLGCKLTLDVEPQ